MAALPTAAVTIKWGLAAERDDRPSPRGGALLEAATNVFVTYATALPRLVGALPIAEAFALGESHRENGARLGIASATARRHLANLYAKLGVSSKAERDRCSAARDRFTTTTGSAPSDSTGWRCGRAPAQCHRSP